MADTERTVMFQLPSVVAGQLACVAGSVAGRSWELSAGTFIIGRRAGCDLYLVDEPGVSKVHAKIVAEGEQYMLEDAESRNGTIVNGKPIRRVTLVDGDLIQVCGCKLRFSLATPHILTPPPVEESSEATQISALNPFLSSEGQQGNGPEASLAPPPPPVEEPMGGIPLVEAAGTGDLAAASMGSLGDLMPDDAPDGAPDHAPDHAPDDALDVDDGPLIPPPPPGTEEIPMPGALSRGEAALAAFEPRSTELSSPFQTAPAVLPPAPSTLPWFVGGLLAALLSGGVAYAAILFLNDGTIPVGPGSLIARDGEAGGPDRSAGEESAKGTAPGDAPSATAAAASESAGDAPPAADNSPPPADTTPPPRETDPAATEVAPNEAKPAASKKVAAKPSATPKASASSSSTSSTSSRTPARTARTASASPPQWQKVRMEAASGGSPTVKAPTAGKVSAILKTAGATVRKGDVIASLGGTDAQAIARLESSVASLVEVVKGSGSEEAAQMLESERKRLAAAKKGGGKITAPSAGTLASLDIKVGESVNAGQNVGIVDGRASNTVSVTVGKTTAKVGSTVELKKKSGGTASGKVVKKTKSRGRYIVVIEPVGAQADTIAEARLP